jgi:6-pyruvoyltetrahydropterin/6-carboxytetrahydropterin synthase
VIVRLTRKYAFSASHRLHSPALTGDQNREIYGKCNNPWGHGHNYEVEVTVRGEVDPNTGRVVDIPALDGLAEERIVAPLHLRNLNEEVPTFRSAVPTTENLALEVERRLREAWPDVFPDGKPSLDAVRIRETERNICEIARLV